MGAVWGAIRRLLAVCGLVASAVTPLAAAEVIHRFDAAVTVRADGVLEVTETIRVKAEGNQIRRGIYRDIPLTFVDQGGRSRRVSFELLEVLRDGRPEPHHTDSNAEGIRIYAGDADVLLPAGVYTYRFRYLTGRQLRFLPGHTELFWNVTGNDWAFPIEAASARFILPGGAAPVRWAAYTGAFGERGEDFEGEVATDGTLRVETTRQLDAGEGISVVLEIPDGLVAPPSGARALGYWLDDYRRPVLAGLGLLGVLAFYLVAWNAVGRDPPKGTIIPLFHPPEDISPALAGYVRDYGWSGGWRAFTAAALSLAVKGLLVFDDSEETIVLSRTGKRAGFDRKRLPPGERAILNWVASKGGSVRIDRDNGKSLASAFQSFKSSIEKESRGRFFRRNLVYFGIGVALTVIAFALVLVFGGLTEVEIGLLFAAVWAGIFFGVVIVQLVRALLSGHRVRAIVAVGIGVAVFGFVGANVASIVASALRSLPDDFAHTALDAVLANSFPFVLVGGFALMNGVFYYLLRAPTAAGRVVMDQIEGLELYIRTAETERLNLAGVPDLTADQFERLLPYAVALGAERPWSEAFAAAFARAHPGEDLETGYRPGWHGGHGGAGGDFGRAVASTVGAAQSSFQSSVPAPRSSSSGFSGGGSGGGGGGGGGGGW